MMYDSTSATRELCSLSISKIEEHIFPINRCFSKEYEDCSLSLHFNQFFDPPVVKGVVECYFQCIDVRIFGAIEVERVYFIRSRARAGHAIRDIGAMKYSKSPKVVISIGGTARTFFSLKNTWTRIMKTPPTPSLSFDFGFGTTLGCFLLTCRSLPCWI